MQNNAGDIDTAVSHCGLFWNAGKVLCPLIEAMPGLNHMANMPPMNLLAHKNPSSASNSCGSAPKFSIAELVIYDRGRGRRLTKHKE